MNTDTPATSPAEMRSAPAAHGAAHGAANRAALDERPDARPRTRSAAPAAAGRWLLAATALLCWTSALAHGDGHEAAGGFLSGFLHPLLGPDHVVAMVAVGLWGAFLGAPAIWVLPVVFPLVMAVGGALGVADVHIPGIEVGIGASAVVLGVMVALAARPPLAVAAVIVGAFAIFHGHAHGTELPDAASPLAFSLGFVLSTGLLHVAGIAFGLLVRWPAGMIAVRVAGGLIGVAGLAFLAAAR